MTQDISGDWHGVLDTGTVKVKLGFRIAGETAWLITRAQGEIALPLWRRGEAFGFEARGFDLALSLTVAGGGLEGTCRHSSAIFPVRFTRGVAPPTRRMSRPQTPEPPFPYEAEEVSFLARDGVRLAGTLTRPPGPGPYPAVTLSTWHGACDRDQTVAGHRPFAIWADALTRLGFATLRFDKRGVGASGGVFATTSTRESTDDLGQAVAFLRSRPEIASDRIGVMGHSEGAHISADAAVADPAIAFCVMMTPAGVPEETTLESEFFRAAQAVGGEPIEADLTLSRVLDLTRIEREARSTADAVAGVRAYLIPGLEAGRIPRERFEWRVALAASAWRRNWIAYDPVAGLRALTCPVLVVIAGQDLQTAPRWHGPGIEAALAGRPDGQLLTLPGLNHFLQHAVTGAPSEYADIEESLAPEARAAVCGWLTASLPPGVGPS